MNLIKLKRIALLFLMPFMAIAASDKNPISIKVLDKNTKEPLAGATIYIPDLKKAAAANSNGECIFSDLPGKPLLIQVKMLGYATISEVVDISITSSKEFLLSPTVIEGKEVIVTGSAVSTENSRSSVSVVTVNKEKLNGGSSTNIIDAISHIPGVSQISTGSAISKPVIRGLGYNRIVTLNEGVKQEGQQWGDEHGIEIDENSADRIEILKGPASLLYGSDAMGGVINFLEPLAPTEGSLGGELYSRFSSNGKVLNNSLMLQGNKDGYSGRLRYSDKRASAYSTPLETVYNSGFSEKNINGMLGINKSWGYTHLHYSRYNAKIGMIEGERDSATGKFIDLQAAIVSDKILNSSEISVPFQKVAHDKLSLVNRFILGRNQLALNLGYQLNNRQEFASEAASPDQHFELGTSTIDAKYFLPEIRGIETVIGMSGMKQQNINKGKEFIVPDYDLNDFGTYIYVKKSWERATVNGGVRFDSRKITTKLLVLDSLGNKAEQGDTLFNVLTSSFPAVSGSLGFTYKLSKMFNLKANIGRGFRAPNIAELGSNGIHEGVFRYEIGNNKLVPEKSLQLDAAIEAQSERFEVSFDVYRNYINDFIYLRRINSETKVVDGEDVPVYRYVQGKAELSGFEFSIDVHIFKSLHFENAIAMVIAENKDTKTPLPFTPPATIHNELRLDLPSVKNVFNQPFISGSIDNHLQQTRIDEFETPNDGYSLINLHAGATLKIWKLNPALNISVDNLLNTQYYEHLNRLKYAGILSRGRNVTVSLTVPFGSK